MPARTIRWGILGTGGVAAGFARDLAYVPDAELLAVASRSPEHAAAFAGALRIPRSYGSYEALASDRDIDVVYIATPNTFHREHCLLCLENGKAVLCEKPFAVTADEAREIVATAQHARLFCMEAMWLRFFPLMRELPSLVRSGAIGELRMLTAQLGFANAVDAQRGIFNPALGGGALLDLGVYTLSLATQLLGAPDRVDSQAVIGVTGVDEQVTTLLGYPGGRQAVLTASLRNHTTNDAVIMGTEGYIHVHAPLYGPTRLSIVRTPPVAASQPRPPSPLRTLYSHIKQYVPIRPPGRVQTITRRYSGIGYHYEAAEVLRCLHAGELESPIMPLEETVRVLDTVDTIRQHWNVRAGVSEQ